MSEFADSAQYVGRLDAITGTNENRYADVMRRSVFAMVPRGDRLFSYRLAEALAFGCIPIVISDGWVMPFDRQIQWDSAVINLPESQVADIPRLLAMLTQKRRAELAALATAIYRGFFESFDVVVEALLRELEQSTFKR